MTISCTLDNAAGTLALRAALPVTDAVTDPPTNFVLYSKPGCHLCEGLEEKLAAAAHLPFALEVRDITTRDDWFQRYQYEIPVLCQVVEGQSGSQEILLPRLSPRAPQARVEQLIQTYIGQSKAE